MTAASDAVGRAHPVRLDADRRRTDPASPGDWSLAEDAAGDAFATALARWPGRGRAAQPAGVAGDDGAQPSDRPVAPGVDGEHAELAVATLRHEPEAPATAGLS